MLFSHLGPLSPRSRQIFAAGLLPTCASPSLVKNSPVEVHRLERLAGHRVAIQELQRRVDVVTLGLLLERDADLDASARRWGRWHRP